VAGIPPIKKKRKHPEKVCKRCGNTYSVGYTRHVKLCEQVPLGEEIAQMLADMPGTPLKGIADLVGCSAEFIRRRLYGTKWTSEMLNRRAGKIRKGTMKTNAKDRAKYFSLSYVSRKCKCGILLKDKENTCQFCKDEAAGIKNYKDKYGLVEKE
jgi:hypothetical protein